MSLKVGRGDIYKDYGNVRGLLRFIGKERGTEGEALCELKCHGILSSTLLLVFQASARFLNNAALMMYTGLTRLENDCHLLSPEHDMGESFTCSRATSSAFHRQLRRYA